MNIQVAKLRLTLCEVTNPQDIATAKAGTELTELVSASWSFSLNTIPSATVVVPSGAKIGSGEKPNFESNTKNWTERMAARTPVCIKLDIESPGIEGLEPGSYIVFKGYIAGVNTGYGVKGGSIQLTIQHWLINLTLLPILNRLSAPGTPADISMEICYSPKVSSDHYAQTSYHRTSYWSPVVQMAQAVEGGGDIFESFKTVLMAAAAEASDLVEENAGFISKDLYQLVDNTLLHVSGANLTLNPSFSAAKTLNYAIAGSLVSVGRESYYSVTAFDKIVQSLLPNFYMTLVPLVDKALVIPAPAIKMEPIEPVITSDNIVKLDISTSKTGVLAGMAIIASQPLNVTGCNNTVKRTTDFCYPPNGKRGPGVIKVCTLPSWIETYSSGDFLRVSRPPEATFTFVGEEATTTADETTQDTKKQNEDMTKDYEFLCNAFIHTAYNAEVTKRNSALLIANLDFSRVPGQVVKIELPSNSLEKSEAEYICGVITTVGISISPSAVQASYRLSSVRDKTFTTNLNAAEGALLYENSWSGKDASLAEPAE